MSSRYYARWGGLAMVVGAVFAAVGGAIQSFQDPTSSLWVPSNVLQLIGAGLILVAIPALYAVLARAIGGLGLAGYVLLFAAGLFGAIGGSAIAIVIPYMAQNTPSLMTSEPPPILMTYFIIAGTLQLLGGVLFGVAIVRAGVPERYAGMLLILGAIISFVGGLLNAVPHLGDLGSVLFVLALGWMGWTLMTRHVAETEPSMAPAEGTTGARARA